MTSNIALASFLIVHGLQTTIDAHAETGGLSQFHFEPCEELDRLVLAWGRGGQVNASRYWAALCELKREIREARREANPK